MFSLGLDAQGSLSGRPLSRYLSVPQARPPKSSPWQVCPIRNTAGADCAGADYWLGMKARVPAQRTRLRSDAEW
jgi:hypothetical protein